jgi:hypothetical protein
MTACFFTACRRVVLLPPYIEYGKEKLVDDAAAGAAESALAKARVRLDGDGDGPRHPHHSLLLPKLQ